VSDNQHCGVIGTGPGGGTDPASSALDVNCRAHEVDNLYVVNTSCFPRIDAVNPSLMAIANAMLVGDHLLEHLR
jgi:choline dehydrogenase-like flavoprotein